MTPANSSERISVEDRYLCVLGRAVYNFVYLEWAVINLVETFEPGVLSRASSLTSGQVERTFSKIARSLPETNSCKNQFQELAKDFRDLVKNRDCLVHGNPYTAKTGEQRLLYNGRHGRKDWTIELLTEFANRTAEASIEAGNLREILR